MRLGGGKVLFVFVAGARLSRPDQSTRITVHLEFVLQGVWQRALTASFTGWLYGDLGDLSCTLR